MSERTVASPPRISSGARYSGVPVNRPLGAAPAACTYCPAPKSMSTRRPPSSRITFCALMSRWTRPALWTDARARHSSWPISAASRAPNDPVDRSNCSSVRPADVLHPQPDPAVLLLDAEDRDDIAMADPRQDAPLVQDLLGELGRLPPLAQELQGDVAVQACVAGPVDVAERPLPDLLDEFEMSPADRVAVWMAAAARALRPWGRRCRSRAGPIRPTTRPREAASSAASDRWSSATPARTRRSCSSCRSSSSSTDASSFVQSISAVPSATEAASSSSRVRCALMRRWPPA